MKTQQIFSADATTILDLQHQGEISIAQLKHVPINSLEFISVHTAFNQNKIKVEEVSESGNVNELLVSNLCNEYIFIMDGDILQGAKQNRVSNTSIYMAPNKKFFIPVSCVEQGRWNYDSESFSPSDELVNRKIRAEKSRDIYRNKNRKHSREKHQASQSRVWDNVMSCMMETDTSSRTQSYSDINRTKRRDYSKMIEKLKINNLANGLAYFIGGKLTGVEIFNRTDVYQDYFQKLLYAIAMDTEIKLKKRFMKEEWALEMQEADTLIKETISDYDNHQNDIDVCDGVCLGKEHRLQTAEEMYYDLSFDEQTIHQSILVFEKEDVDRGRRDRFNPTPIHPVNPEEASRRVSEVLGQLREDSDNELRDREQRRRDAEENINNERLLNLKEEDAEKDSYRDSFFTRIKNFLSNKKAENERG